MNIEYVDILTREYLSTTWLICGSVRSFSRSGRDIIKGVDGCIIILGNFELYLISIHENLVQHPSNHISNVLDNLKKQIDRKIKKRSTHL